MKTAIVVVPGMGCKTMGRGLEILQQCLLNCLGPGVIAKDGTCQVNGVSGTSLKTKSRGEDVRIDMFEAFWEDCVPDLTSEPSPVRKAFLGARVLWYWMWSPVWRVVFHSKYLLFGMLGSSLLMSLWYMLVLPAAIVLLVSQIQSPPEWLTQVTDELKSLASGETRSEVLWWAGGITSFLLVSLPVNAVVNIASFTMTYLTGLPADKGPMSLRHTIHRRVGEVIQKVATSDYDRVIVASHSFGTIVAMDVMSRMTPESVGSRQVGVITIASPAKVLAARSHWFRNRVASPPLPDTVSDWLDLYSDTDWLCSAVPLPEQTDGFQSRKVDLQVSLLYAFFGAPHVAYFRDETVAEAILNAAVNLPPESEEPDVLIQAD